MGYQAVFKRYEIKYMITQDQKQAILDAMAPYMTLDKFGKSTIRNIYFDTDDYILARHSIAKPDFKEKLRIRSYSKADADSEVFVELKRKYDHVVYKRRIGMPEADAMKWMAGSNDPKVREEASAESGQVSAEIDYFLDTYHGLKPAVFLSYDREAYKMKDGASGLDRDFRVTFDENVLSRNYDISLRSDVYGERILEEGKVLMELKCSGGIPLWMTEILSELKVYKTSFSKYGTAYQTKVFPAIAAESAARYKAASAAAERAAEKDGYRRHFGFGTSRRHATA